MNCGAAIPRLGAEVEGKTTLPGETPRVALSPVIGAGRDEIFGAAPAGLGKSDRVLSKELTEFIDGEATGRDDNPDNEVEGDRVTAGDKRGDILWSIAIGGATGDWEETVGR